MAHTVEGSYDKVFPKEAL